MSENLNNGAESVSGVLLHNCATALVMIDEAMAVVAEACKQQMFDAHGKQKKVDAKNLFYIAKALAVMRIVCKSDQRLINPPGGKDAPQSYEDWIHEMTGNEKS